jgi:Raf kinase inhibitor-like YbhB/YbcL family protein
MAFKLTSPAFADGAPIPVRYTCDGDERSPQLTWSDPPAGTRSFVLIADDPDAPRGTFTHWVLYNIPGDTSELAESGPDGTVGLAGRNGFGRSGYGGPCPPAESDAHRYRFHLYALDVPTIGSEKGQTRDAVEALISEHVLGMAQLVGTYRRAKGAAGSRQG